MNVKTAKLYLYPGSLPHPTSVSAVTDYGVIRSDQPGFAEQTRNRSGNYTQLTITFRMNIETFAEWAPWVDFYATQRWCLFPVPTQYPGVQGDDFPLTREVIRFGNISHNTLGGDMIDVTAEAEILPMIALSKSDVDGMEPPLSGGTITGEVVPPAP